MSGGLGQRVGLVSGFDPSSSGEFVVALDQPAHLAVDDLVCVESAVPGIPDPVLTFGIVTENHAALEGAQYQSDTHRISDQGLRPAQLVRSAQVAVTRILPEVWVAPSPGAPVFRVAGERRRQAIYHDTMSRPLAVGVDARGEPVYIDVRYFDGDSGGHMSISGISGVATKTTYALFFLRLLVSGGLGPEAANTRVLVFNVKGEDLLWLDKRSNQFSPEDELAWRRLGSEAGPFALAGGGRSGAERLLLGPGRPRHAGHRGPRRGRTPGRGGGLLLDPARVRGPGVAQVRVRRPRRRALAAGVRRGTGPHPPAARVPAGRPAGGAGAGRAPDRGPGYAGAGDRPEARTRG